MDYLDKALLDVNAPDGATWIPEDDVLKQPVEQPSAIMDKYVAVGEI